MSSAGLTAVDEPGAAAWTPRDEADYHRNNIYARLVNRKAETVVSQKVERQENTARRIVGGADKMPQYYPYQSQYYAGGASGVSTGSEGPTSASDPHSTYSVNLTYRPTSSPAPSNAGSVNPANGYAVNSDSSPSPMASVGPVGGPDVGIPQLVSRTTTQNRTQQVTTVTKVIKSREYRQVGPDGQLLEFDPSSLPNNNSSVSVGGAYDRQGPPFHSDYATYGYGSIPEPSSRSDYGTYDSGRPPSPGGQEPTGAGPDGYAHYGHRAHSPASEASSRRNYDAYPGYQDYEGAGVGVVGPSVGSSQPRSPLPPPDYALYHMRPGEGNGAPTGGGSGGYNKAVLRPPTPPSPNSEASASPPPQRALLGPFPQPFPPLSGYDELDYSLLLTAPNNNDTTGRNPYGLYGDYPATPNSPSATTASLSHAHHPFATPSSNALYDVEDEEPDDEEDEFYNNHMRNAQRPMHSDVRWRDPDLQEVIEFLRHPNNTVKANACAYLQHLCYSDDHMKQKARGLGAISPLVELLNHEITEVHRNACGALRNLSYGRQNDENKRAVKNAGGIPALIRLLRRIADNDVRELVTGILWNLSSCEDLKKSIIEDGLSVINMVVIIPHSGWDRATDPSGDSAKNSEVYWSTVFRNASGVLRNVSSAGEFARRQMRECEGLVDSLLYLVKAAIGKNDIDNKSVENCVCILRNLSYRCQEQEDPLYDQHELPPPPKVGFPAGDNLGCFGGSKKKKESSPIEKPKKDLSASVSSPHPRTESVRGMDLLWQPEVVKCYLDLLADCSNPETLEAAAGAIQNLAACYWQPSIDIRAAVRKAKGLPILVELLRMEVDRVVCAVATALRNLALDQRNKELIGKYAMKDLVQKLPSPGVQHDTGTSDETFAAVLATLNEVIRKNAEFARSLLEADGIDRLMHINGQRGRFSPKVVKFASQVLYNLWQHQELNEAYKKRGWKEANFVSRTMAARSLSPSNANSTLNRPISTQGGTKYEDKTLQRPGHDGMSSAQSGSVMASASATSSSIPSRTPVQTPYNRPLMPEEVPLNDMPYPAPPPPSVIEVSTGQHRPPVGGVQVFPPGIQRLAPPAYRSPNEPVYAQVNREKKKIHRGGQYDDGQDYGIIVGAGGNPDASHYGDYELRQPLHQQQQPHNDDGQHGGDSWV